MSDGNSVQSGLEAEVGRWWPGCRIQVADGRERILPQVQYDNDETFAPVISYENLLMTVGTYVLMGWVVHNADICTTFLDGIIDGELHIE